jgi:periplasmic protein TonB
MRNDGRAVTESFLLHGLLAGVMLLLAGLVTPHPKMIRLDFGMLEQTVAPAPKVEPEQKVVEPPPPPAKPEPVPEKIKPLPAKIIKSIKPRPLSAEPVPTATPTTEAAQSATPEETSRQPINQETVAEKPAISHAEQYRSANFGAIRDRILANLHYPTIARRKGWSGKVEIAFTIMPDGSIQEMRILASSGYPLLDEQAIEAIRQAAPFTPPRVVALLVMPVTFQLN